MAFPREQFRTRRGEKKRAFLHPNLTFKTLLSSRENKKKKREKNNNAYNDLGDDFGLAERPEGEGEEAAEKKNKCGLNYKKRKREMQRIVTLPKPIRRSLNGGYIYSHG